MHKYTYFPKITHNEVDGGQLTDSYLKDWNAAIALWHFNTVKMFLIFLHICSFLWEVDSCCGHFQLSDPDQMLPAQVLIYLKLNQKMARYLNK